VGQPFNEDTVDGRSCTVTLPFPHSSSLHVLHEIFWLLLYVHILPGLSVWNHGSV
jgi:hypothetical protein